MTGVGMEVVSDRTAIVKFICMFTVDVGKHCNRTLDKF